MALTDSLVSHWKLDEASGDALDAHSTNDLTDNNTVGSATGKINNGRDFELDSAEYFSRADNAALSTGDIDYTFACWVKAESLSATFGGIVAKDTGAGNREYQLLFTNSTGRLSFQVFDGTNSIGFVDATTFGTISAGTWYFVVVWHDAGANQVGIYINGTSQTAATSGAAGDSGAAFEIGRDFSSRYWDGLIDEVSFWKRVLTSDEKTALYNGGNGLAYPWGGQAVITRPRLIQSPLLERLAG